MSSAIYQAMAALYDPTSLEEHQIDFKRQEGQEQDSSGHSACEDCRCAGSCSCFDYPNGHAASRLAIPIPQLELEAGSSKNEQEQETTMSAGSGNLHPAIAAASGTASAPSASASRARSTSRGRSSNNDASVTIAGNASGSVDHQHAHASGSGLGSHPRSSGGMANAPLPSPSAVHINQSLEDSLRRGEEERLRRSAERRDRRRRRIEQSKQRHSSKDTASGSSVTQGSSPADRREASIAEDPRESNGASVTGAEDASIDSIDDESALVTSPVIPQQEDNVQVISSSDDQIPYYREGYGDDDYDSEDYEEELDGRSLTRQLAETAVSVREMSRELGRARVKSNIQSVLIVTKARDNQLIKLTREIALYLMKTPRYGRNRGLVVYVDSQLKTSKRFDAAGIERENPSLFRNESRHHHHHHHHHHHGSHGGGALSTSSGSGTPRRSSSRRTSHNASAASSLNLFGMTRADLASSTASLSALDRNHSAQSSGATTPAPGYPKPMTKLTEALVTRQIDRQLEKENQRRQSQSAFSGQNGLNDGSRKVAFSTTSTPNEAGAAGGGYGGDEQQGLLRYWTAEMCSKSPQLFDLVLTVSVTLARWTVA